MKRLLPALLLLPLLASCGSAGGPSSSDKLVVLEDKGNTEFNCTKRSVKIYANNDYGVKEGWYTMPEFRKAFTEAGGNSMAAEFMIGDLLQSADAKCK